MHREQRLEADKSKDNICFCLTVFKIIDTRDFICFVQPEFHFREIASR
jgi:hypothetical protein